MRELLDYQREIRPVIIRGKTYHVREMTLDERLHFSELSRNNKEKNEKAIMARILRMCVCDADGNESFTDDDIPKLESLQAGAIGQRLLNEAFDLNLIGSGALDSEKKD